MPRHARLRVPGYPVHVMQRGHDKRACFREEGDYLLYLALLRESALLFPSHIHAFVLMTNHVHLLMSALQPDNVSRVMKRLNERYAMHYNKKYQRTGGVWEGRFKSSLIDTDSYLLCCQRYIELNPVRAGMVKRPEEYAWSSYRTNALGEASDLVTPHAHFLAMHGDEATRHLSYRRFVSEAPSDAELTAIRAATSSCAALGTDEFIAALPEAARRRWKPPGRPRKQSRQQEIPLCGKPGTSRF